MLCSSDPSMLSWKMASTFARSAELRRLETPAPTVRTSNLVNKQLQITHREAAQGRSKRITCETQEMEWAGLITPREGERRMKAAEVAISDAYHPGYKIPCESRGDVFYPAIITNHGGWDYQSSNLLRAVTHSGDKVDCTDLEAERFDHCSRTWSS